MNDTLFKALLAFLPVFALLVGSAFLYAKTKRTSSLLQLLGASCLMIVVIAHVCEALNLFPSMRWGAEDSVGHYVDLWSAVFGLSLFPIGYLIHALAKQMPTHVA